MPGIAGLISQRPPGECERLVEQMIASMQHEKFYTSGTYSAPDLGAFAGWVAIEDSFAQKQPIVNERGDVAFVVAGECYSDSVARARIKERNHRFADNNASWLAD